jgi:hypothetical protein
MKEFVAPSLVSSTRVHGITSQKTDVCRLFCHAVVGNKNLGTSEHCVTSPLSAQEFVHVVLKWFGTYHNICLRMFLVCSAVEGCCLLGYCAVYPNRTLPFGGKWLCLHLQVKRESWGTSKKHAAKRAWLLLPHSMFSYYSTQKIEAVGLSEMLVNFYQITWCNIYHHLPCQKLDIQHLIHLFLVFRVEFQSKFYSGSGYGFTPFSFKTLLEDAHL